MVHHGLRYEGGTFAGVEDALTVEVGLSIAVNGTPFTITMQTPGNENDLVRGLLYTENIIRSLTQHPRIDVCGRDADGSVNAVRVSIAPHLVLKDFAGTRHVMSASSCGICGQVSLDDDFQGVRLSHNDRLDPAEVPRMFAKVSEQQRSFQQTGGTHAAGAFTLAGEMLSIQEDIGRHNAVDKVIGNLIQRGLLDQAKCLTVSGRVSYEIVKKCLSAAIPYLAAVSAPSSLAVDYAEACGITLMAFCRDDRLTVFSNVSRVAGDISGIRSGRVNRQPHVEKPK